MIITALQGMFSLPALAQDRSEEYQLKAVLLSRLVGFITWPGMEDGSSLTLCIAGEDPFDNQLDLAFRESNVSIKLLDDWFELDENCNLLFISDSEIRTFDTILALARAKPILTVSDVPRFATNAGMIELRFENRRVRFLINKGEADAVGVGLSFQLLKLAEIIETGGRQ